MPNQSRERLIVGSLALVAIVLALTPWWLRYADSPGPLASASVLAVVLIGAALLAANHRVRHAASLALAGGAWAMLSPIVLGFWDLPTAFWSHMIAGFAAILLSAGETDLFEPSARPARDDRPSGSGREGQGEARGGQGA